MKKNRKFLKSLLAIIMAFVMVGTIIPTMAFAAEADTDLKTEITDTIEENTNFLDNLLIQIRDFFHNIIDFFKRLFNIGGINDKIPVESVSVAEAKLRLIIGDSSKIDVILSPENASNKSISFVSSDETVVTVDNIGNVNAIARGTATITITSIDDESKFFILNVVVEEPDPNGAVLAFTLQDLIDAINEGATLIAIKNDIEVTEAITVPSDVTIIGKGYTLKRAAGAEAVNMFSLQAGAKLTLEDIIVDGGAVWTGEADATLLRGTTNEGLTASGAIITCLGKSDIILNEGAVLQNNDGANAVSLNTRIGSTLTLNGGEILNNHSAAGAIWGGGAITINSGKVNGNHGGIGGAIRAVTNIGTILTMNGGEMNHNLSDGNGGAIWAGSSRSNNVYVLNGGEMAYNYSATTGGAIYAGYYETVKIGGTFKMHDNSCAADIGAAIRFHDHASFVMTGGEIYNNAENSLYLNNNSASITGGKISDSFGYSGGLGLTMGNAEIDGIIKYNLATNHNTAYLAKDFGSFKFTVAESANFSAFNFKPAADYEYTEGDEAKLICMNEGYETYWDAAAKVFKIQAV